MKQSARLSRADKLHASARAGAYISDAERRENVILHLSLINDLSKSYVLIFKSRERSRNSQSRYFGELIYKLKFRSFGILAESGEYRARELIGFRF